MSSRGNILLVHVQPVRLKYPYIRSASLTCGGRAVTLQQSPDVRESGNLKSALDPVAAWQSIVEDPGKEKHLSGSQRKGGFVRVSLEEARPLLPLPWSTRSRNTARTGSSASLPYPRCPWWGTLPLQVPLSHRRFHAELLRLVFGFAAGISQVWGEQTDVPESADCTSPRT